MAARLGSQITLANSVAQQLSRVSIRCESALITPEPAAHGGPGAAIELAQ
jgi:hypothetical protein